MERHDIFKLTCISITTISKQPRPQGLPDLTPLNYFLWCYLEGQVYRKEPRFIPSLKPNSIQENSGNFLGTCCKEHFKNRFVVF